MPYFFDLRTLLLKEVKLFTSNPYENSFNSSCGKISNLRMVNLESKVDAIVAQHDDKIQVVEATVAQHDERIATIEAVRGVN